MVPSELPVLWRVCEKSPSVDDFSTSFDKSKMLALNRHYLK